MSSNEQHTCECGKQSSNKQAKHTKDWLFFSRLAVGIALLFFPWRFACVPALLIIGFDVFGAMFAGWKQRDIFTEQTLMCTAVVAAVWIGDGKEAVMLMGLYQLGEWINHRASERSRQSITALCDMTPQTARVGGVSVPIDIVDIGSHITVNPGEVLPLDGIVYAGTGSLDTANLTGESLPRVVSAGEAVLAGSVNLSSPLTIETTVRANETVAAKTIRLIQEGKKPKREAFIRKFAKIYTPCIMAAAFLLAVVPPLLGADWNAWIYRGIAFLVAGCPCALVISIPACSFAGLGGAAHAGILFKDAAALEAAADIAAVALDKTGTVTENRFTVSNVLLADKVDKTELFRCAAYAEQHSSHPLAAAILDHTGILDEIPGEFEEIPGKGIVARVNNVDILAGNRVFLEEHRVSGLPDVNDTAVLVARNGLYIGGFVFTVPLRAGVGQVLRTLRLPLYLLTGDTLDAATKTAAALDVPVTVHAALLPNEKEAYVREIAHQHGSVMFVGDGVNDAAALRAAHVGVAFGGIGTDISRETADVVIQSFALLPEVVIRAKHTRRVTMQNIVFVLTVKAIVLGLAALGIAPLWLAVAADTGTSLVAIGNSIRARMS